MPPVTKTPVPKEEAAQYASVKMAAPQTSKAEKISGPLSEEQRKQNLEKFSKLGIPSIAGLKQKEQQLAESDAQKATLQRNSPFDDPAFKHAWEIVCSKVKEMDKDSLLATLSKHAPEVDFTTYMVRLMIDNRTQEQMLNREKVWILEMLRDLLQNDQVNFDIVLTEDNNNKQQLYTQRDRFMKLAEKNPSLIYLTKKFGLDL